MENTVASFKKSNSRFAIEWQSISFIFATSEILCQLSFFCQLAFQCGIAVSLFYYLYIRKIEIFLSLSRREDKAVPSISSRLVRLLFQIFKRMSINYTKSKCNQNCSVQAQSIVLVLNVEFKKYSKKPLKCIQV